jgi:hypothetical protein
MPAYAPTFTARYIVRYSAFSRQYSIQFRSTSTAATAPQSIVTAAAAFLDALAPVRSNTWTVLNALWYRINQNVSVPAPAPTVAAGTANISGPHTSRAPGYWGFTGRTVNGQRAQLFLYGVALNPPGASIEGDWRISSSESSVVSAAVAALNNAASQGLCGSDGATITWKPYVNIGFNSYQIRRARGS